jgi:hypothetical protein
MVWPMVGFVVFMLCFYGLFLLNEREIVRGETIKQDKMLHDPHAVADLLGQISRSNAGSKSLVKFMGRICPSNCWVKLLVEICESNSWIKFLGQICRSNPLVKRTRILGPPLASLGARMDAPTDSLKTGKD